MAFPMITSSCTAARMRLQQGATGGAASAPTTARLQLPGSTKATAAVPGRVAAVPTVAAMEPSARTRCSAGAQPPSSSTEDDGEVIKLRQLLPPLIPSLDRHQQQHFERISITAGECHRLLATMEHDQEREFPDVYLPNDISEELHRIGKSFSEVQAQCKEKKVSAESVVAAMVDGLKRLAEIFARGSSGLPEYPGIFNDKDADFADLAASFDALVKAVEKKYNERRPQ